MAGLSGGINAGAGGAIGNGAAIPVDSTASHFTQSNDALNHPFFTKEWSAAVSEILLTNNTGAALVTVCDAEGNILQEFRAEPSFDDYGVCVESAEEVVFDMVRRSKVLKNRSAEIASVTVVKMDMPDEELWKEGVHSKLISELPRDTEFTVLGCVFTGGIMRRHR